MLNLLVRPVDAQAFEHLLEGDTLVIGRSSRSGLRIPDRSLSRTHAKLFLDGSTWYVQDLGSRNGTSLNGSRIDSPRQLKHGDIIEIGGSTVAVRESEASGASADDGVSSSHTMYRPATEFLDLSTRPGMEAVADDASELRRYAERLRLLNEVHQALGTSVALDNLLDLILDRAFDHLQPEQGAIFLRDAGGEYSCAASRSNRPHDQGALYSRHLVREVADKGLAALVIDAQVDDRFKQAASLMTAGVRSLVAAPLLDPAAPLGMIVLGSTLAVRQFTEEDMELLTSLASVAAMRIRNVRLAEEAAERRLLENEVRLARQMQIALLPTTLPEISGWELHAENLPSRGVSGDFYKVLMRDADRELAILVADVSGKGIGASILTGSLEALSAAPILSGEAPDAICRQVSQLLFERTRPEKYATAFLGILDIESGRLTYVNAGHNPCLVLLADGSTRALSTTGTPLGILSGTEYTSEQIDLGPGDTVAIYTDGIVEAENSDEEQYGQERLLNVCVRSREEELAVASEAIEEDLDAFVQGVPFADDRTLVMIRRQGG